MEYKDYYAILEVPRTADQAEVKKAYRRLARRHHPDMNKGRPDAERRFKEINEAYEVLGDPQKRHAYDTLGANWAAYQQAGHAPGGEPFADFVRRSGGFPGGVRFEYRGNPEDLSGFSDFFRTFFAGEAAGSPAGGPHGRRARQGQSFGAPGFEEFLGGLGLNGLGLGGAGRREPGRGANGRGARRQNAEARAEITLEEAFRGTTRLVEVDGHRYEVTVPPGVADGQRIRLRGKAGSGSGGGDLFLVVRLARHPVFERRGDDLVREVPLSLREALLGGEVPVQTLTGRVLLKVPPATQNGRVFRLTGQGMPRLHGSGRGDLLVRTSVVLPAALDESARDLAARFLDHVDQPDPRAAGTRQVPHASEARTRP